MTGEKLQRGGVDQPQDRSGQLRLLIVLDTLLREGSVSRAAASMGIQPPAMSRMLSQLREIYGDPLFHRTARGLVPTPLADSLRVRVRALAAETDRLLNPPKDVTPSSKPNETGWCGPALLDVPPLAVRPSVLLDGQPSPEHIANKLSRIGDNAPPMQRLAKYIALSGAGVGRSRSLGQDEARDALAIILDGEADPVQIGALLATMQYRGATTSEFAGFVEAVRQHVKAVDVGTGLADLDWPVYLSPKLRSSPWFMHAVRLVGMAGYRVAMHGSAGGGQDAAKFVIAAKMSGIPVCTSIKDAKKALKDGSSVFIPLETLDSQITRLIGLYPLMEMRSPLNSILQLINPLGAKASIMGASGSSRRDLHRDISMLLDVQQLSIIGNIRDIPEFWPFRATTIYRLLDGAPFDFSIPGMKQPSAEPDTLMTMREYWHAVWTGAARDERMEMVICATAAMALMTIERATADSFQEHYQRALRLWKERPTGVPCAASSAYAAPSRSPV